MISRLLFFEFIGHEDGVAGSLLFVSERFYKASWPDLNAGEVVT